MKAIEMFLKQIGKETAILLSYPSITSAEYAGWQDNCVSVRELPLKVFTILCSLSGLTYDEVLKQLVKYEILAC